MTLTEARKILGLGPDDDPRTHLDEFRQARERIAEMVRNAPNETLAIRYQQGLVEFDQALASIREHQEALGLATPRTVDEKVPGTPATGTALLVSAGGEAVEPAAPRRSRVLASFLWFLVFLTGAAGGALLYWKNEESKSLQRQARITFLERIGSMYVENRRWQEAAASFAEIEALAPGSRLALLGRRSIEAGMTEEQTQFIGYWTGQAIAELDAGRLDEAQTAIQRVREKFPADRESAAILQRISSARINQSLNEVISAARKQLDEKQWDSAIAAARGVLASHPDNEEAMAIMADATDGLEKNKSRLAKARELLEQAIARDHGQFDQEALDWLREAAALDPENGEISSRLEKLASYTRTLRVPGDFATPSEALAAARKHDRIVLSEQIWKGPLVINLAVELQGAGTNKTIIECPAAEGSAITIGPDAKDTVVRGITIRHDSFVAGGTERFSAALVRGGSASFADCRFSDASGHGLAVIENGEASARRCRFSDNGWNGAAAIGKGSLLEVKDSESVDNFEHGIESWDGAAVTLVNNRCEGNSRNGIHADNGDAAAIIEGNQLIANREFGLVIDSAASGKIIDNMARANLLGGFVIRKAAASLPVNGNQATLNQGPGLVLEKGLSAASYASNTLTKNTTPELVTGADLSNHETNAGGSPTDPDH